jgi:hypothetical protein
MNIVTFPDRPLSPAQQALPSAQLCALAHDLIVALTVCQLTLQKASDAPHFAAEVWRMAAKLDEASAEWASMADTIRESWRI